MAKRRGSCRLIRAARSFGLSLTILLVSASTVAAQFCIDVNTAPAEQLQAIVHIGPERAEQVVRMRMARPFGSVDDLTRVEGVAAERLADIKEQRLACVRPRAARPGPAPLAPPPAPRDPANLCVLRRVVDGDTLDCEDGRIIRLLLVDTPEMDQAPFGSVARQMLRGLAPVGTRLVLELDVRTLDQYQRVLAYVRLPDGRMINEELLRVGVATVVVYPPNVRYVDRFRSLAAEARSGRVGFWAVDGFACPPSDHRAGRC